MNSNITKKSVDPCDFMEQIYGTDDQKTLLAQRLRSLESAAKGVAGVTDDRQLAEPVQFVPARAESRTFHNVRLWHPGFQSNMAVRGAPLTCDVCDVVTTAIAGQPGLDTVSFPLDVLFELGGGFPGSPIQDFKTGLSEGMGTTMGCYLVAVATLELDLISSNGASKLNHELERAFAHRLLTVLHLRTKYFPMATAQEQAFHSLASKCAGASRQRPSILAMASSLKHAGLNVVGQSVKDDVFFEKVKAYQDRFKSEPQKRFHTDELVGLKLLAHVDETFLRLLRSIWSSEKIQLTSVPLSLLANSSWLNPNSALQVSQQDNPVWYDILSWSIEKMNVWLLRVDGRFTHNINKQLQKKGKKCSRNILSPSNRDDDPQLVWRMACLWVSMKSTHTNIWTPDEMESYMEAFYKGEMDSELKDKATVMDPSFTPDDVRYVKIAKSSRVSGDDHENLTRLGERTRVLAEMNLFHARLLGEESVFSNYRAAHHAALNHSAAEAPTLQLASVLP